MNNKIEKALQLARKIYSLPEGACGGPLHIVLDDGNTEETHIQWCLEHLNDSEWSDEMISLCKKLGELMLEMTSTERETVYFNLW